MKRILSAVLLLAAVAALGYAAGASRVAGEPATLTKGQVAEIICYAASPFIPVFTYDADQNALVVYAVPRNNNSPGAAADYRARMLDRANNEVLPLLKRHLGPDVRVIARN
jgi:hypothetical protein